MYQTFVCQKRVHFGYMLILNTNGKSNARSPNVSLDFTLRELKKSNSSKVWKVVLML